MSDTKTRDEIWDNIQQEVQMVEVEAQRLGLYHRGWRFWPPYGCGRCGRRVTAYQFAFSRSCGGCDLGESRTARLHICDPRWFIIGPVQLENPKDSALINPMFLSSALKYQFGKQRPRLHRHLPRRPVPKRLEPIRRKIMGLQ